MTARLLKCSAHRFVLSMVVMLVFNLLATPLTGRTAASLEGCPIFPADSVWNTPVEDLPVDTDSNAYIAAIGAAVGLHPDFGSGTWDGGPIGIPHTVVDGSQPEVDIVFDYDDESDPGPYPIPARQCRVTIPETLRSRSLMVPEAQGAAAVASLPVAGIIG